MCRKRLLIAMHEQRIRDYKSVSRLFQAYYIDAANVMDHLDDLRKAIGVIRPAGPGRVARIPTRFQQLNADLISTRSGITVEHYLSNAILASGIVAIVFLVVGYIVTGLIIAFTEAKGSSFTNPTPVHLPYMVGPIPMSLITQVAGAMIGALIAATITYMIALQWPAITKGMRASKINMTLHNAVAYMYAMRKGVPNSWSSSGRSRITRTSTARSRWSSARSSATPTSSASTWSPRSASCT